MKVLITEDVAALRQHAAKLLADAIPEAEVSICESGAEGIRLARTIHPDLIVMDISMPDLNGIKAAQQIWAEFPTTKILFWSQYHREAYVRELGRIVPDEAIHGYVLKSETDEKFLEAACSIVFDNNPYIDPVVKNVQHRLKSKSHALTDNEYETLIDIAVGLTDKTIALRRNISVRGVQSRLAMLTDKLVRGASAELQESTGMEIYNLRTRVIFEALKRGLLDPDDVAVLEKGFTDWLSSEFEI